MVDHDVRMRPSKSPYHYTYALVQDRHVAWSHIIEIGGLRDVHMHYNYAVFCVGLRLEGPQAPWLGTARRLQSWRRSCRVSCGGMKTAFFCTRVTPRQKVRSAHELHHEMRVVTFCNFVIYVNFKFVLDQKLKPLH